MLIPYCVFWRMLTYGFTLLAVIPRQKNNYLYLPYIEKDHNQANFKWKRKGTSLLFDYNNDQLRQNCAELLSQIELVPAEKGRTSDSCYIFNETATEFSCTFVNDEQLIPISLSL